MCTCAIGAISSEMIFRSADGTFHDLAVWTTWIGTRLSTFLSGLECSEAFARALVVGLSSFSFQICLNRRLGEKARGSFAAAFLAASLLPSEASDFASRFLGKAAPHFFVSAVVPEYGFTSSIFGEIGNVLVHLKVVVIIVV